MSFWVDNNVWAYSEEPELLNKITDEELIRLVELWNKPDDDSYILQTRKETAGKIEYRKPHICKMSAGNKYGHYCLCASYLSEHFPDVIFVSRTDNDCSEDILIYVVMNGKKKSFTNQEFFNPNHLDNFSFAQVKKLYDEAGELTNE